MSSSNAPAANQRRRVGTSRNIEPFLTLQLLWSFHFPRGPSLSRSRAPCGARPPRHPLRRGTRRGGSRAPGARRGSLPATWTVQAATEPAKASTTAPWLQVPPAPRAGTNSHTRPGRVAPGPCGRRCRPAADADAECRLEEQQHQAGRADDQVDGADDVLDDDQIEHHHGQHETDRPGKTLLRCADPLGLLLCARSTGRGSGWARTGLTKIRSVKSIRKATTNTRVGWKLPINGVHERDDGKENTMPAAARTRSLSTGTGWPGTCSPNRNKDPLIVHSGNRGPVSPGNPTRHMICDHMAAHPEPLPVDLRSLLPDALHGLCEQRRYVRGALLFRPDGVRLDTLRQQRRSRPPASARMARSWSCSAPATASSPRRTCKADRYHCDAVVVADATSPAFRGRPCWPR